MEHLLDNDSILLNGMPWNKGCLWERNQLDKNSAKSLRQNLGDDFKGYIIEDNGPIMSDMRRVVYFWNQNQQGAIKFFSLKTPTERNDAPHK